MLFFYTSFFICSFVTCRTLCHAVRNVGAWCGVFKFVTPEAGKFPATCPLSHRLNFVSAVAKSVRVVVCFVNSSLEHSLSLPRNTKKPPRSIATEGWLRKGQLLRLPSRIAIEFFIVGISIPFSFLSCFSHKSFFSGCQELFFTAKL